MSRYVSLKNVALSKLSVCTDCGAILYNTTITMHDASHVDARHDAAIPSLRACLRLAAQTPRARAAALRQP